MAFTSVVARRYAEGLLRVVKETGRFEEVARELHRFLDYFETRGELREVMLNPAYSTKARRELLDALVAEMDLSPETSNLLRLLIQKRRIQHLPEIVEAFDDRYRAELGIVRAEVVAVSDVDGSTRTLLENVVARITGKMPELAFRTDPAIIGGIRIRMGNTILDASIKTKLERLRESLVDPASETRSSRN